MFRSGCPRGFAPGWYQTRLRRFHAHMGVDRLVDPYPEAGAAVLAWLAPPAFTSS